MTDGTDRHLFGCHLADGSMLLHSKNVVSFPHPHLHGREVGEETWFADYFYANQRIWEEVTCSTPNFLASTYMESVRPARGSGSE